MTGVPRGCLHTGEACRRTALIAVGNELRRDDGIAQALCRRLSPQMKEQVCIFDLGPYTQALQDCLDGHRICIIIDSTANGITAGSSTIIDLSRMLAESTPFKLRSTHGLSLFDELQLIDQNCRLPDTLIFFGVEAADAGWGQGLSDALEAAIPHLIQELGLLLEKHGQPAA